MSTTTDVAGEYRLIEIDQLHESPLNPRKIFAAGPLQELAASIRASGIITPLIARPNAKGFEIAAGHRRYRAAKLAELLTLPTIVREMDDKTFVEILNIENLQRQDMTPLEEAEGYRLLMTKASYKVERIAERVGRSVQYVYDRIKLLELIPEAAKILREDKITAGHAILLARLKPADQKRAIHPDNGGVFQQEYSLEEEAGADAPEGKKLLDGYKPKSVRELDAWIARHVRFDAAATDPMIFPETAQTLAVAKETEEKVVKITHELHIRDEARDPKERTIVPTSWKRADGKRGSKTCEHSVIGVVVTGPGRGESFRVCLAKEKCPLHWSKWQKERAQRQRASGRTHAANGGQAPKKEDPAAVKRREEAAALQQRVDAATFRRVLAALWKASWAPTAEELREFVVEEIEALDAMGPISMVFGYDWNGAYHDPKGRKLVEEKVDKLSASDLIRLLFLANQVRDGEDLSDKLIDWAKGKKVDAKAIEKAVRAELTPTKKEEPKKKGGKK